jgi:hypothetical protein
MLKFTMPRHVLVGINEFSADKDVRFYLQSVAIDMTDYNRPVVVSTDGCILGAYQFDGGHNPEGERPDSIGQSDYKYVYVIPNDAIGSIAKVKAPYRNADAYVTICIYDIVDGSQRVTLSIFGVTMESKLIDRRYPYWREVIPSTIEPGTNQFDVDLLARANKGMHIALGLDPTKTKIAVRHNKDGASPIYCGSDQCFGVIMPIRTEVPEEWSPQSVLNHGLPEQQSTVAS